MPKQLIADHIVGKSPALKEVLSQIERISQRDVTVLIEGESGTGKELIARAIHYNGPRKQNEFVVINCSAFSDTLLESELFGYMKGAFTGAVGEKKGLFEIADQGTFFMDEIADMSPALQVKLLRVLEEGTFFKVGGTTPIHVNVRIVAATNKNLKSLVENGRFRDDLYYRLNVVRLYVPPLRERCEDIPLLIEFFLSKMARKSGEAPKKLGSDALRLLQNYAWPGNIRQLENELERAVILSSEPVIQKDSFRHLEEEQQRTEVVVDWGQVHSLNQVKKDVAEQLEREAFKWALARTGGNKSRAAQQLGISRQDFMRKCGQYQNLGNLPKKKERKTKARI